MAIIKYKDGNEWKETANAVAYSGGYNPTDEDLIIQDMPMTRLFSKNNFLFLLVIFNVPVVTS